MQNSIETRGNLCTELGPSVHRQIHLKWIWAPLYCDCTVYRAVQIPAEMRECMQYRVSQPRTHKRLNINFICLLWTVMYLSVRLLPNNVKDMNVLKTFRWCYWDAYHWMVIAQMKRRMIKMNISSQIGSSKDNIEFPDIKWISIFC